jgi:hypothetical protein
VGERSSCDRDSAALTDCPGGSPVRSPKAGLGDRCDPSDMACSDRRGGNRRKFLAPGA